MTEHEAPTQPTRRGLLAGMALTGLAGCAGSDTGQQPTSPPETATASGAGGPAASGSSPAGSGAAATTLPVAQPGIDQPVPIQRSGWFGVYELHDEDPVKRLNTWGSQGIELMRTARKSRLTLTWGLGQRLVRELARPGRPGAENLPSFRTDRLIQPTGSADLYVQIRAESPAATAAAQAVLHKAIGPHARLLWSRTGDRGQREGAFTRNLVGFFDGIVGPTRTTMATDVWLPADSPWAGATIGVVRVMPVDVAAFTALPLARQEAVFGRRKVSGAPLSGDRITDPVSLQAKTEDGVYDIPTTAHARAAHPLISGAKHLMLRRSYNYRHGAEEGLVFVSFQRELNDFIQTQYSMDETDALMTYTHTIHSGSFVIPPAPSDQVGMGDWLLS